MRMGTRLLSAGLSLFGIGVSTYLLFYKWQLTDSLVCTFGNCEVINTSPYSEIVGIPVALLGVSGYALLLALNLWGIVKLGQWVVPAIFLASLIGVLFSAYLTYIEVFVLRAICQWCVVSAFTILAIFLTAAWEVVRGRETRVAAI